MSTSHSHQKDAERVSITKVPDDRVLLLNRPHKSADARDQLDGVESIARWTDSIFHIPALRLRFGLDALIGLIPGLGDTVTSFISLYILTAASKVGVSRLTMTRMAGNIAVDYLLGCIPLLGDVFDLYWKANQKNAALLRRDLAANPVERRRAAWGDRLFVGGLILVLICLALGSIAVAYAVISWVITAIRS